MRYRLLGLLVAALAFAPAAAADHTVLERVHVHGETPWHASWQNPVNRNLHRLARCETGGINSGRPLWTHGAQYARARYGGALGFLISTWTRYRHEVTPLPPALPWLATPAEQYAVGRALVHRWPNYSSWPACSIRLGLR